MKFGTQTNSSMQNLMVMFTFSIFDRKYFLGEGGAVGKGKFGPKQFNGSVQFFCFQPEIPFLDKLGPKNQNCQFKLKFGTYTNSNMKDSMVALIFSIFDFFCVDSFVRQVFFQKFKIVS